MNNSAGAIEKGLQVMTDMLHERNEQIATLTAELEAARADVADLKNSVEAWRIMYKADCKPEVIGDLSVRVEDAEAALAAERARAEKAEAALGFYADIRNWNPCGGDPPGKPTYIEDDRGKRARFVIEASAAHGQPEETAQEIADADYAHASLCGSCNPEFCSCSCHLPGQPEAARLERAVITAAKAFQNDWTNGDESMARHARRQLFDAIENLEASQQQPGGGE